MAASDEAIAQLALSHLGNTETLSDITTSPTSKLEILANRFYTIARRFVLKDSGPWAFANRRELLVIYDGADDDSELAGEWTYAFTVPSGALQIRRLIPEGAAKNRPGYSDDFDYEIATESDGTTVIYTNISETLTYAEFVYDESDTTVFDDNFTLILSYYLAYLMATGIIKGKAGIAVKNDMLQTYELLKRRVTAIELNHTGANRRENYKDHTPVWVSDR